MIEESRPGVWETAILREDGSIVVERMVVFEDDNQAHSDKVVKSGTPEYEEIVQRHPGMQLNKPHEIELPRKTKQSTVEDPNNFVDIKFD